MYVCICNAIRESEVKAAADGGVRKAAEYFRAAGTRPQCGRCVDDVQAAIDGCSCDRAD